MRRCALLLTVFGLASFCSGQTFRGSTLAYENGYVIGWSGRDAVDVTFYRSDARALYSVPYRHSESRTDTAWAVDSDGWGAVGYYDSAQKGWIDVLDATGRIVRTIGTGTYDPVQLTFAADHSIWAVGYEYAFKPAGDFRVVRHYAPSGDELGEAVPWARVGSAFDPANTLRTGFGRHLFAGKDRIGFSAWTSERGNEWIEVSLSGVVMGKYDVGRFDRKSFEPGAMTDDGRVYGRIFKERNFVSYGVLDRATGSWRRVSGLAAGKLMGADGEQLVLWNRDEAAGLQRVAADQVVQGPESIAVAEGFRP